MREKRNWGDEAWELICYTEGRLRDRKAPRQELMDGLVDDYLGLFQEYHSHHLQPHLEMLRELEWTLDVDSPSRELWCRICWNYKDEGHAPDCRLGQILGSS